MTARIVLIGTGGTIASRHDAQLGRTVASPRGEAVRLLLYLFGRDEAVRLLRAG